MKKLFTLFAFTLMAIASYAAIIDSGTCGKNGDILTWILSDDGVLTISGTGEMKEYYSYSDAPWYSNREKKTTAAIGDNVTSIGDYAFEGCI